MFSKRNLPLVLAVNYAINPTTLQLMFADAEELHFINSVISSLPENSPAEVQYLDISFMDILNG